MRTERYLCNTCKVETDHFPHGRCIPCFNKYADSEVKAYKTRMAATLGKWRQKPIEERVRFLEEYIYRSMNPFIEPSP